MFTELSGLIGVVHLPALPGDPAYAGQGPVRLLDAAARDAEALAAGGASAVLVENFGSWPFPRGDASQPTPPSTVALLALAVARCRDVSGLPVGVNVLRNDSLAALGIAVATGACFVRVNVLSGAVVTDQGIIQGSAHELLRARRALQADGVGIAADVRVKHARPLVARPVGAEVADLVHRAGAQALIVTGEATGAPIDRDLLQRVRDAGGDTPVWLGSGVDLDSAPALAPFADAAIVGTSIKRNGDVRAPVDPDRVRRLVDVLRAHLRP